MRHYDLFGSLEDFKTSVDDTEKVDIPDLPNTSMERTSMDILKVTSEYFEMTRTAKNYCPVYVDACEDGHTEFSAYLTGQVKDVDNYVDLIDVLLCANERDVVTIYIDSPGGLIASGGIIASAVHHSRATVRTVARGLCASAAALIHSAAKPGNAYVTPFAVMLYHMSSHMDHGVSTQIAARAENQVRYVNETLLNKALADGHITEEEFNKIQTGEEIIISGDEFAKRVANKAHAEE